jgi:hypothetical protein
MLISHSLQQLQFISMENRISAHMSYAEATRTSTKHRNIPNASQLANIKLLIK